MKDVTNAMVNDFHSPDFSKPDFSIEKNARLIELLDFKYASMRYAYLLQEAMMHEVEGLYEVFPESFLFSAPKDIVSGDFHWFEQFGSKFYVGCADCTGHGIPGAMLSILCTSKLHDVVRLNHEKGPAKILEVTNDKIFNALSKKYGPKKINDGMDIGMFSLDFQTGILEFAGANNCLCLIRNNVLNELQGDKQTVGVSLDIRPFTTYKIKTEPGDMIYLFSDGYADQFGGEKGKKFSYKRFMQLLVSLAQESAATQRQQFEETLRSWMGSEEQVDDITVLGIRI
jgi:serine phosphatase RsbU (regulator of sigma subunit)